MDFFQKLSGTVLSVALSFLSKFQVYHKTLWSSKDVYLFFPREPDLFSNWYFEKRLMLANYIVNVWRCFKVNDVICTKKLESVLKRWFFSWGSSWSVLLIYGSINTSLLSTRSMAFSSTYCFVCWFLGCLRLPISSLLLKISRL